MMTSRCDCDNGEEIYDPEILDEMMHKYLRKAETLMKELKMHQDVEICEKIIVRCELLNDTNNLDVKANRNFFFKYFLKILNWTVVNQPIYYDNWLKERGEEQADIKETSYWSADKRSYVAAKTISNMGILVYLAVSSRPELGWQENGFSSYDF